MKKNFLMVASLLIAAMLMVVSCTQEVAPKNELVEAKIGLAYGRDVEIKVDLPENTNKKVITYKYSLSPKWNQLDKGTKIFGEVTDEPIDNSYGVSDPVNNVNIGPLTPGLWEITVKGFAEGAQVLEGKTAAYFVKNGNNTATVFVSPVNTTAKETVKIELKMEDLGSDAKNVINCSVSNLAAVDATPSTVTLSKTENSDASYTYNAEVELTAGYNTITFTTSTDAGEGGITKTFLLIPGLPVIIKGSVYPAEFVTGTASIQILNMNGATLGIKKGVDDVTEDTNDKVYELTNSTDYSISVDDASLNLAQVTSSLPAGTITGSPKYTWFVNGKEVTGNEVAANISNGGKTLKFNKTAAGDYTVTCTIELDYTYHDAKDGTPTVYHAIGDASLGNIRVLPAPASTTNTN